MDPAEVGGSGALDVGGGDEEFVPCCSACSHCCCCKGRESCPLAGVPALPGASGTLSRPRPPLGIPCTAYPAPGGSMRPDWSAAGGRGGSDELTEVVWARDGSEIPLGRAGGEGDGVAICR